MKTQREIKEEFIADYSNSAEGEKPKKAIDFIKSGDYLKSDNLLPLVILNDKYGHAYNPLERRVYRLDPFKKNQKLNLKTGDFVLIQSGSNDINDKMPPYSIKSYDAKVVGSDNIGNITLGLYPINSDLTRTIKKLNTKQVDKALSYRK